MCSDIDECVHPNVTHDCNVDFDQDCSNTIGSYDCLCKDTFYFKDGVCNDVNECDFEPCMFNAICNNYAGGFNCSCEAGYEMNAPCTTCDSNFCTNANECDLGEDECPSKSTCLGRV